MKNVFYILLTLWSVLQIQTSVCFGQQAEQYTQYLFNNFVLNPAVAGSKKYLDIKLGYRTQWVGFQAAPKTMFVSGHRQFNVNRKNFGSENHDGIGGYVYKDDTGPWSKMGAYAVYAFHLKVTRGMRISAGVSVGFTQLSIETGGIQVARLGDPAITPVSSIMPDGSIGIWVYSQKFFGGVSLHQFVPMKAGGTNISLSNHYYLMGGYYWRINDLFAVIPMASIRLAYLSPVTADISVQGIYKRVFWLGAAYRKGDAVSAIVGFWIGPVEVGYAYDFGLSSLRNYHSNTHEIIIGIRPPRTVKTATSCPTFEEF